MKERLNKVGDLATFGRYFFVDPDTYDEDSRKKNWKPETREFLKDIADGLGTLSNFGEKEIEEVVRSVAGRRQIGASSLIHPLRLALTGISIGLGLFELMAALGKDRCLRRIEHAIISLG